jgi:F-type H+-transporting ATPase subunit a
MDFFQLITESVTVKSSELFSLGGLTITDTMVAGGIITFLIILICFWVSKFKLRNPSKTQVAFETIIESIHNFLTQISGDIKLELGIITLLISLVLLILMANLMTIFLPFLEAIKFGELNFFRTYTSDFNTTLVLALLGVILTQVIAIKKRGFLHHFFNYIQLPQVIKSITKGPKVFFEALIGFFVGILDVVGELARIVSLSFRLFGNLFAGVILIGVFASFFAILLPIPIILLSTLAGIVQAIVFGALVTSYIAGVSENDELSPVNDDLNLNKSS